MPTFASPPPTTVSVIMIWANGFVSRPIFAIIILDPAVAVGRTLTANPALVISPVQNSKAWSFAYSKSGCGTNAISTCE